MNFWSLHLSPYQQLQAVRCENSVIACLTNRLLNWLLTKSTDWLLFIYYLQVRRFQLFTDGPTSNCCWRSIEKIKKKKKWIVSKRTALATMQPAYKINYRPMPIRQRSELLQKKTNRWNDKANLKMYSFLV